MTRPAPGGSAPFAYAENRILRYLHTHISPGYTCRNQPLQWVHDRLKPVFFQCVTTLEISSSDIRERAAAGRSIAYLVPADVETYIRREGIYQ